MNDLPVEDELHNADGSHRWTRPGRPGPDPVADAEHRTAVESHLVEHRDRQAECGIAFGHTPGGRRAGTCAICAAPMA